MKKRFVAFLLVLVMLVPCVAASAATYYRLKGRSRLFYLPDYNSKALDSYRTDWALTVNKNVDKNWASITFTNGRTGYIERSKLVRCSSYTAWVTKNDTPMRHGPDYSFANVGTLNRGDKVTVLTHGSSYDYVKTSGGSYGYVANNALSKKKVTKDKGSSSKSGSYTAWVVSNGGQVGLRSSASGSNNVVFAKYWPGTKVTVLEYGSEFSYIKIDGDGNTGYMRSKYISKNEPAPIPADPTPVTPTFTPYTTTACSSGGNSPRLYQGEGLGWSSVKLTVGTTVNVVAKGKDPYWVKVELNDGRKGYMPLKFLN